MKKKITVFLQIARWRMLSLFRTYFDKLQSRTVLIAGITLCLVGPSALAAYYRTLSSFNDVGQNLASWLLISVVGAGLIALHGKNHPDVQPEAKKTFLFEKTLPLNAGFRLALDCLDTFWIQIPAILLVLLSALTDRLDFHHQQSWGNRFHVMFGMVLALGLGFLLNRISNLTSFRFRLPHFYIGCAVMKTKAIFKNYPSFVQLSLIWISLLSFLGAAISRISNSAQPRLFLYFLFLGLQILPLSKIPALLSDWDKELDSLLSTLPESTGWTNSLPYIVPSSVLIFEGAIWVALSYSQPYLLLSFVVASFLAMGLFFLLQMRFAKWALMAGVLITLTGASALQASVK